DFTELRMHSVFTCAQVHGPNGKTLHHGFDLVERQAVRPRGIAVAKRAGQIAFIGKPESECNSTLRNCLRSVAHLFTCLSVSQLAVHFPLTNTNPSATLNLTSPWPNV